MSLHDQSESLMTALEFAAFLRDRYAEAIAATEGTGRVAWLTYENPDGSLAYTTVAAGDPGQSDEWVVDGREVTKHASAQVIYDEDVARAVLKTELGIVQRYRALRGYESRPYDDHPDPSRRNGYLHALEVVMTEMAAVRFSDHPDYPTRVEL